MTNLTVAMAHISVLSASVRTGRNSHRVALFLEHFVNAGDKATADIIDLAAYDFPIFHERLKNLKDPAADLVEYAGRVKRADAIIIVTPEYNGGYPAALKNAVDVLYDEWHRKPVAIATVSDGAFGGTQVITSLQFSLWKIRAWTVTARFPVPDVRHAFGTDGVPVDAAAWERRASALMAETLWCVEANRRMAQQ